MAKTIGLRTSFGDSKLSKKQAQKLEEIAAAPVAGLSPEIYSKVYTATIFTSAALLFMIQPMIAKMMLPLLGGAPAVWTTCMLFFQAVLLGGYLYAHAISGQPIKKQVTIHLSLLALGLVAMPIRISHVALATSGTSPAIVVLALLALSVGLPFFVLSASAPLLQNWFSRTGHINARDPYFLYVASNIGSMIALLGYPIAVEPFLGLKAQSWIWSTGYLVLAAGFSACAYLVHRSSLHTSATEEFLDKVGKAKVKESAPPSLRDKARWVALALVPSSLMLGVTTYFTTDIATIPLLWVIPLSLYLLSFILAFGKTPDWVFTWANRAVPVAVLGLLYSIVTGNIGDVFVALALHLATFFIIALAFHGRIAKERPSAQFLTQYFLLMSFGGMLGGVFNGVIAPHVFNTSSEYPLALVFACLLLARKAKGEVESYPTLAYVFDVVVPLGAGVLAGWLCSKYPLLGDGLVRWSEAFSYEPVIFHRALNFAIPVAIGVAALVFRRYIRFGLTIGAAVFVNLQMNIMNQDVIHQERSFFGILKVSGDANGVYRTLTNGTTLHGKQLLLPGLSREPLSYYHRLGPVGQIFEEFVSSSRPQSFAAIGLGTGSLASYGRKGQKVTIYEIDEAVKEIATKYFTYVRDSEADVKTVMGDARLKLNEAENQEYGLILVDAFSSDAIPVHLLTEEAVRMYFQKLAPNGIVAIHTSNRYLSLEPVLAKIAEKLGLTIRVNHDQGNADVAKLASTWVVLTKDVASLGSLKTNQAWKEMASRSWFPHWTDDFTSVMAILR